MDNYEINIVSRFKNQLIKWLDCNLKKKKMYNFDNEEKKKVKKKVKSLFRQFKKDLRDLLKQKFVSVFSMFNINLIN